jgi:hypothetical protein
MANRRFPETCQQPVDGKTCDRIAKWKVVVTTILGANDEEGHFTQTWYTCGSHDYDLSVTLSIKDVSRDE